MFLKSFFTTIILFSLFFVGSAFAEEKPILFWGTTCPYCHEVLDKIAEVGLEERVEIEKLEVYENQENLKVFYEKIDICNLNQKSVGIPLLYAKGECVFGVDPILAKLESLANSEGEVLSEEDVSEREESSEGKKNTEIMIFGGVLGLVVMVLLGSILQKKKGVGVFLIFVLASLSLIVPNTVFAMCPVCTVAVGAGLGFSRYLGIDDVITGVWIGGMILSATMWMVSWLKSRGLKKWISILVSYVSMYLFLAISLYFLDVVGHSLNTLWGVDKILLGIFSGSVVFAIFAKLHLFLKEKNSGKVYIPFQKVVFTVGSLLLLTIFFYLIVY